MPPQEPAGPWQNYEPQPWLDETARQAALAKAGPSKGAVPAATTGAGPWDNFAPQPWLDKSKADIGKKAPAKPPAPDVVDAATRDYYIRHAPGGSDAVETAGTGAQGLRGPLTWGEQAMNLGRTAMEHAPQIGAGLMSLALGPEAGILARMGVAALGGMGGRGTQYAAGTVPTPTGVVNTALDLGEQGAAQIPAELLGYYGVPALTRGAGNMFEATTGLRPGAVAGEVATRGGGALAVPPALRRVVSAPVPGGPPPLGTSIMGTTIPESVSQRMQPGMLKSLAGQAEHYLGRTWVGQRLRDLVGQQQVAQRDIVSDLIDRLPTLDLEGQPTTMGEFLGSAAPDKLVASMEQAREAFKLAAAPLQERIAAMDAPQAANVAREIQQSGLKLPGAANTALENAAPVVNISPALQQSLKQMGHNTWGDAVAASEKAARVPGTGEANLRDWFVRNGIGDQLPNTTLPSVKMTHVMALRDELDDLAKGDASSPYWQPFQRMNRAIKADLGTDGQAATDQIAQLQRQSAITDQMAKSFEPAQMQADPKQAPAVLAKNFVTMVNRMIKPEQVAEGGTVVTKKSMIEQLYPNDREAQQAWINLASWLRRNASAEGGRMGEAIASMYTLFRAPMAIYAAATGHFNVAAGLGGMWLLSHALANPGMASQVLDYFQAAGTNRAGPLAVRILQAVAANRTPAPSPMPSPEDFRPLTLPAQAGTPTTPPQVGTPPPLKLQSAREYYEKKGITQRK